VWAVINTTPYAADRSWVQDKDGNKHWIVVVKATFDIEPNGLARLADEQVPVLRMGQPWGELGKSSLRYESDLLGLKPRTDILVNGTAWAGGSKRNTSVDIQLTLGSIKKRLRVFGNRYWHRRNIGGIVISDPEAFEALPITYERAFGGWDCTSRNPAEHRLYDRNPVGTGFLLRSEGCIGVRLPNIEYPNHLISSWKDRPMPAGLNAVECSWSPRRELAGTYDEKWRQGRFPLWAEDYDSRYNNCAPTDQQMHGYLRGGEEVELINLSPNGCLRFSLPRVYPFFITSFGFERVEHRAQLCTIIIEPDKPCVIMAWQTSLMCNHRADELDATVVTEKRMI
jgi:hypothetical protein